MKINRGDAILDIPSKSIEDDTIGTIRYKEARDRNQYKLKECYIKISYFRTMRKFNRNHTMFIIGANGRGSYRTIYGIRRKGECSMLRSTLKGRWFNG